MAPVLRASDDKEQIQSHNTNEEIILTETLKDGGFVVLNNLQVVLRHEIEVEQREIL
jgi:sulfur carrier protein ThiS